MEQRIENREQLSQQSSDSMAMLHGSAYKCLPVKSDTNRTNASFPEEPLSSLVEPTVHLVSGIPPGICHLLDPPESRFGKKHCFSAPRTNDTNQRAQIWSCITYRILEDSQTV